MSDYKAVIRDYAPSYWNKGDTSTVQFELSKSSDEFKQLQFEVCKALKTATTSKIEKIERIQVWHDLGQLLVREQFLIVANPGKTFYRVRRYIKIKKQYLQTALNYNLDFRRCGIAQLQFRSEMNYTNFCSDDLLIAVQVVTSTPRNDNITPDNSLEFFIDYIIYFN